MTQSRQLVRLVPVLGFVLALAGCGRQVEWGEVEGTVRIGPNPLPNVRVTFLPDPAMKKPGQASIGVTDQTGRYRLIYDDSSGRPGAIVGNHVVLLEDLAAEEQRDRPGRGPRIHARLASVSDTPLKREVRAGKQTLDLEAVPPLQ